MNIALLIIGVLCIVGIGMLFLQMQRSASFMDQKDGSRLRQDLEHAQKETARLQKDLDSERKEKNELSGKGKELYDRYKSLESEHKAVMKERDSLNILVTRNESQKEQQERAQQDRIEKLEAAEKALKEERQRVIQEEQEMRRHMEEERDRVWADHEMHVIAELAELSKLPSLQFTSYSNTNLPEDFDGKLKPDFLIEFLGQYVIFDAKASKAQSLQTYINEAVKSTADKVKKNPKIYPHIFLVVPTEAIGELKKLIYAKDEYYFYIVSREALAPILACLKRISTYELAESLDPQKRENIINMISELSTHISTRNAYELLLTKHGADTLERVARIDPEIAGDVERKNVEKKYLQFSPSEIKRLSMSLTEQNIAAQQLVTPSAAVKKKQLAEAETTLSQRLG